jgi:hypothetical protein
MNTPKQQQLRSPNVFNQSINNRSGLKSGRLCLRSNTVFRVDFEQPIDAQARFFEPFLESPLARSAVLLCGPTSHGKLSLLD